MTAIKTVPKCHPEKKHGAHGLCVTCYNKDLRHRNSKYAAACSASTKRWQRNNPDKYKCKTLRFKYGISLARYNELFEKQGCVCAICKKAAKKYYVDHAHLTGEVRGILCPGCNTKMAAFDDKIFMEGAEVYVNRHLSSINRDSSRPILGEVGEGCFSSREKKPNCF